MPTRENDERKQSVSEIHYSKRVPMQRSLTRLSKMLLLSETDVRQCLSMKDCVEVNRRALAALRPGGGAKVPTRLGLPYYTSSSRNEEEAKDWSLFKPAAFYGNDSTEIGMKFISVRADNPSKGLPLVPATVVLLNAATGEVQAVLGGTYLTGARTAAGSAVATDLVAFNKKMKHLVIFGAGLQAECHIEALQCVQPSISRVTIVNRSRQRAEDLVGGLPHGIVGTVVLLDDKDGIQNALQDADVVVTCTNTETPLFDGSWLPSGCHINGVGSYTPEMQEVDMKLVNRCRVLVDTPESLDVGDLKHLDRNKHPWKLLGEVIEDPSWLYTATTPNDCTFFKSTGTAIQDILTASVVVDRAKELGLGTEVDMS